MHRNECLFVVLSGDVSLVDLLFLQSSTHRLLCLDHLGRRFLFHSCLHDLGLLLHLFDKLSVILLLRIELVVIDRVILRDFLLQYFVQSLSHFKTGLELFQ
jgi:hypothetical protein